MRPPRTILLVKLSAIGDALHGIPAAVAAKDAFPEAIIGWVVEGRSAEVLEGHAAIDRVFRLPRGWAKRPAELLRIRGALRGFAPDVTIDMQGLFKSALLTAIAGSRVRVGHARPEAREGSWLATNRRIAPALPHVVERNCGLLAALGVRDIVPRFDMPRWPTARARMEQWVTSLGPGPAPVILNPGAGWSSKLWPEERFAAVARRLSAETGRRCIVVWGGAGERALAERIATGGDCILAPQTSLQELGELCRLGALFISSDTGPLHLAAAVGTPCVGLFGPVPAVRNGPFGAGHATVEPPPSARPPWKERKTDSRAMAAIGVEPVVAAATTILARSGLRQAG
jgi:heptosyltransferase-1